MAKIEDAVAEGGLYTTLISIAYDIGSSPLNIGLLALCLYLLYKIVFSKTHDVPSAPPVPQLPPMKKRDMTHQELRKYDGSDAEGRICVAVNGKIFDVTKGKRSYGPGGPYSCFAGRDATRGLATFSLEVPLSDEYDDISDLNSMQMDSLREWETQFMERYSYVGRLLKPGEEPTDYSDEEDASQDREVADNPSGSASVKKDE